jgi:hypothetical protein
MSAAEMTFTGSPVGMTTTAPTGVVRQYRR